MPDGVEDQIANSHLLTGSLCAAGDPQGNDQAVLDQFIGIVGSDHGHKLRNGRAQTGFEFEQELSFNVTVHRELPWRRVETQKAPDGRTGWGILNEVGGLTRQGARQASKLWEREKVCGGIGQSTMRSGPPSNAAPENCERACLRHEYITRLWRPLCPGPEAAVRTVFR